MGSVGGREFRCATTERGGEGAGADQVGSFQSWLKEGKTSGSRAIELAALSPLPTSR
jgi:hypothetical protein